MAHRLLTSVLFVVLGAGCVGTPEQEVTSAATTNSLQNGSFETGTTPWALLAQGGASATLATDCSTSAGANSNRWSEKVAITQVGTSGIWDVQLRQGSLSLAAGQTITISFAAMTHTARTIEAGLQQAASPWAWYSLEQFGAPGDSAWHVYHWTFTQGASDGNVLLNFNLGQATGDVWIDDVVVTANGTNVARNGSFEAGAASWALVLDGGAAATSALDCATSGTPGARWSGRIHVAATGADGAWDVQLRQGNQPLASAANVTVSFAAMSKTSRTIEAGVQQLVSPWAWYSLRQFQLPGDGAWHTYTWTYTQATSDDAAAFNVNAGQVAGDVWIDDVAIRGAGSTGTTTGTAMAPPAGYTTSQRVFEDTFSTSSLDLTKWNPWLGDDRYGRWSDQGLLSSPYSGMNCNSTCSATYQIMYYDPYPYGGSQNTTGAHMAAGSAGLRQIATPSSYFGSKGYRWASAAISSYGKAYLPAAGGYVQWRAKMPDSRYGAWAGLWLLSANGAEMDIQESGYVKGSAPVNNVLASHWQGTGGSQIIQDTGADLSAGYHTYGIEYRPGQAWKVYLDGRLMATWTSGVPTNAAYQVLIDLEIAGPNAAGWHTVSDAASHPGPFELDVSEVQIYKLP